MDRLEKIILERVPPEQVLATLKALQAEGWTKDQLTEQVEAFRVGAVSGEVEDRATDALDIITGWCGNPEYRLVWND